MFGVKYGVKIWVGWWGFERIGMEKKHFEKWGTKAIFYRLNFWKYLEMFGVKYGVKIRVGWREFETIGMEKKHFEKMGNGPYSFGGWNSMKFNEISFHESSEPDFRVTTVGSLHTLVHTTLHYTESTGLHWLYSNYSLQSTLQCSTLLYSLQLQSTATDSTVYCTVQSVQSTVYRSTVYSLQSIHVYTSTRLSSLQSTVYSPHYSKE